MVKYLDPEKIKRMIRRTKDHIDLLPKTEDLSNSGNWSKGYLEGRLSLLQDILDELEEG